MKIYHKYIHASKYLDENSNEYLFDDVIKIDIEIDFSGYPIASSTNTQFVKFPGKEQFRQDVINLLENKYGFEVIEDVHDGKRQKGYFSNRDWSTSLYLDTYVDLNEIRKLTSYPNLPEVEGKMFCFIHIRFSDHEIPDEGDVLHRNFLKNNTEKYISREDVTHYIDNSEIILDEKDMNYYYNQALEDLKDNIDYKIPYWIKKAKRKMSQNNT